MPPLTMWQPTLTFANVLHGRLWLLTTFLCVVSLSIVSEALHLPLRAQVKHSRTYIRTALQLPNAKFVFVFEGALLPFT